MSMVSSNVGPSGVPGLSKMAVTVRPLPVSRPSMLSSGPGRYSSISRGRWRAAGLLPGRAGSAGPRRTAPA